ncbi:DUF1918 domain-containing protein [Nocardia aurantiaca]|uniref:DUF1918 domain-containing protein n=1 Tax=Nocardia aurantiaca TaxID=2675850 RepID=A0A6I3L428_9NOCA|nr:DUF1918 domain-containing protein [Nocardia aurantiaca]MTE16058.1 DUF1918 domain-containing protein [Nocardia aurantiaca]
MYAKPGDWLIVEHNTIGGTARHGLIEEVHGDGGEPPYLVHWTDTGRRALIYPGPDAYVLSSEDLRTREEIESAHLSSMQHRPGRAADSSVS